MEQCILSQTGLEEVKPANLAERAENIGVCYDRGHRRISCSLASISALLLPSVSRIIPRAANTSFNSGTVRPAISAAFVNEMRCCRHNATAPVESQRRMGVQIQ